MTHQSENVSRLEIIDVQLTDVNAVSMLTLADAGVFLVVVPSNHQWTTAASKDGWQQQLRGLANRLDSESVLAILTTSSDAAETILQQSEILKYQLWVAVKHRAVQPSDGRRLPEQHAALLIFTKYRRSLKHTKTRIGYSFCPVCDKTTKDYGGKKHTYHEYGTLMSDVWRDITWSPSESPTSIVERLADVFGVSPHRSLTVISVADSSTDEQSKPKQKRNKSSESDSRVDSLKSELIQNDCLEALRMLPSDSVDFCFADPPYNLAKHYDSCDDALDIRAYFKWCDDWLDELARVLRPGRTCAVLNIPQWTARHFSHLRTRLTFQNWIAWEGLSLPVRMIMPANYSIACFSKGEPRLLPGFSGVADGEELDLTSLKEWHCLRAGCVEHRRKARIADREPISDLWWDIHRLKHNSKRVDHPCQLPPALMRRLIALFTKPDEIVLDPFDGAGTTSLCAAAMARRFIGIELSKQYHEIAKSRHELLADGGDPFAKTDRVPQSKNSRVKRIGQADYKIPKKTLQLEVRQIAQQLGRLPTRDEVAAVSQYPIGMFDDYFISWGEVCAAARTTGMQETRPTTRSVSRRANSSQQQRVLFETAEK